MTTPTRDEVIQMARDAGVIPNSPYLIPYENARLGLERLVAAAYARGAATERESRKAAQTQVAELQERLNRADAEKCAAVLAERKAWVEVLRPAITKRMGAEQVREAVQAAIRARSTP